MPAAGGAALSPPSRIMVTGAAGFVGKHLLPVLRAAFPAAELVAATRGEAARGYDRAATMDLLDPSSVRRAVAAVRADAIVHLAAQANVQAGFADPLNTWKINLLGTLALGEAVLAETPASRFVLASSAEVYGLSFRAGETLNEEAAMAPANPYAASKAAADLAVGEMALRGLQAVRLRPFNHTGPGQSEGFVVSAFARQIAEIEAGRKPPVIHVGALDRWRDFLDVRDVCAAYAAAIAADVPAGSIFNIASGAPRRVGEVLEALIARAGIDVRVEEEAARLRPTDVIRTAGDASRAANALGWRPSVPFEDTIDSVLQDWRRRVAAG
jgi:GDP-4-dehydro-6-deoxy-D-mannose reductase